MKSSHFAIGSSGDLVAVQSDCHTTTVILSEAVFQAQRRVSGSTGLAREPNCTTTGDLKTDPITDRIILGSPGFRSQNHPITKSPDH